MDFDGDKMNLMRSFWELDGKPSPPVALQKDKNIPWGHVCITRLAHPFKK
jgi:hypothetical protein